MNEQKIDGDEDHKTKKENKNVWTNKEEGKKKGKLEYDFRLIYFQVFGQKKLQ